MTSTRVPSIDTPESPTLSQAEWAALLLLRQRGGERERDEAFQAVLNDLLVAKSKDPLVVAGLFSLLADPNPTRRFLAQGKACLLFNIRAVAGKELVSRPNPDDHYQAIHVACLHFPQARPILVALGPEPLRLALTHWAGSGESPAAMVKEDAVGSSQATDKQTISFSLASETVEKLRQRASRQGQSLEVYLQLLTTRSAEERTAAPTPQSEGRSANGGSIALRLEPASEQKLREAARSAGLTLEEYLEELAERAAAGAQPSRLERELAWLASRTKEDVEATRQALLSASRPARPVPEGKTLADVVEGKWPGDETDEQVRDALDRLS